MKIAAIARGERRGPSFPPLPPALRGTRVGVRGDSAPRSISTFSPGILSPLTPRPLSPQSRGAQEEIDRRRSPRAIRVRLSASRWRASDLPPRTAAAQDDPEDLDAAAEGRFWKKMLIPPPVTKAETNVFADKLTAKDPVEPGHGFRKSHRVRLAAERIYEIELMSPDLHNPFVTPRNADGTPLKNVADLLIDLQNGSNYIFTPDKAGEYELVVSTRDPGSIGDYTLTVRPIETEREWCTEPPPVEAGDIVVAPLMPLVSDEPTTTHGYIEYRFLVQNYSDTQKHQVTIWVPRGDRDHNGGTSLRSMRKSATLGPRSDVQLSLFQPYVRLGSNSVGLEIDGRPVSAASLLVDVAHRRGADDERGVRVAVDESQILWFNANAQDRFFFQQRSFGFGLGRRIGNIAEFPANHKIADPPLGKWSESWLGLGQYDGISVPGKALDAAPDGVQTALWQYVETGGTLLVLGPCNRLPWTPQTKEAGLRIAYPGFGACVVADGVDARNLDGKQWAAALLPRFGGSPPARPWSQVTGTTEAHRIFPVVENVEIPIRGLCAFMLAFAVAIGPVNMYVLSRIRRRIWLLWTVPALSLLTTALLFLYVAFTDGWRPHLRADIVTILDERTQRASSVGWLGYFSPTTSGSGLRFSLDTELSPHFEGTGGRGGRWGRSEEMERWLTIDWTDDQHLEAGWLTSKVPLHFLVRRSHKQQERLQVRLSDGAFFAVNGLGAELDKLWLADRAGAIHEATEVKAGVEAKLTATALKAANKADTLRQAYADNWLKTSEGMETTPESYLRPGCYIAVSSEMPFVEPGVEYAQTKKVRSVVFGILKDVP